jgi:predicted RNA methylase
MQTTGLKRDPIDKFYTSSSVAKECITDITQHLHIDIEKDIIIEPSAGNGSFIAEIKKICNNTLFYDIAPESDEIIKQDYLQLDLQGIEMPDLSTKIHIIGNPPFGRQSTLAIQFIKKSATVADTISFILPKSFKKDSMIRHFPKNFHLIYQKDIATNSFLRNNVITDVPCVLQIWEKRDFDRITSQKMQTDPAIYQFVKFNELPDISFRRVGVNAGVIDDVNLSIKSPQSHYFIKFAPTVNKKDIIATLRSISYVSDNTVGPKSISKQEIIKEFNKIYKI